MRDPADRDPIDVAIDRAVRRMTARDPRPDFTRRVLDRLRSPVRSSRWNWLMPAVAAATVLILAVVLWPRHEMPAQRSNPTEVSTIPAPRPTQTRPDAPATATILQRAGFRHVARRPAQQPTLARSVDTVTATAATNYEIEPLPGPEPIEVAPLATHHVAVSPLTIRDPLTVQRLEVPELKVDPIITPR